MFCSRRNVWQGSGEIWRSLTDARFHPPGRRVEGLKWCIQYEARVWANRLRRRDCGWMVPSRGHL